MTAQSEGLCQANQSKSDLPEGSPSGRRARLWDSMLSLQQRAAQERLRRRAMVGWVRGPSSSCFLQQVLLKNIWVVPSMRLYDSIYMMLKNRQNKAILVEVKIVVILVGTLLTGKRH